jgi:hypothetical protein
MAIPAGYETNFTAFKNLISIDDDDDVYLIEMTTCGLQNLSPY